MALCACRHGGAGAPMRPASPPREPRRVHMKNWLTPLVLALGALSFGAHAADASCEAKATEKKLAGAAKASFVKKCEAEGPRGTTITCETVASGRKLAGAAKTSF